MSGFKMMKVFDIQDAPNGYLRMLTSFFDDGQWGNNCYIDWYIHSERFEDPESEWAKKKNLIDGWLIGQGASAAIDDDHEGEHVLIKIWW